MAYSSPRTWVTGETVTSAHLNQEIRDNLDAIVPSGVTDNSWSPTWDGSSSAATSYTVTGANHRVAGLRFAWVRFVQTSTGGEPSGTFQVTLPGPASSNLTNGAANGQIIGTWMANDSSSGLKYSGPVYLSTSSSTIYFVDPENAVLSSSSVPFAWDTNDVLTFQICYPEFS